MTFSGSVNTINTALSGMTYAPTANYSGAAQLTIATSDGDYLVDTDTVTINVTPVNDIPVITSNGAGNTATISVAENQKVVTTVAATDADATDTILYSIVGGRDAAKFQIDATTGELTFNQAPDFEDPQSVQTPTIVGDAWVTTDFGASTSGTLSLPANLQKGDVVIIGIGSDESTPNLPTGWNDIDNTSRGSEDTRTAYLVVGDTLPSNPSISNIKKASVGYAFALRGYNPDNFVFPSDTVATGNSGMPDSPSVSSGLGTLVFAIGYLDDENVAASVTVPSGYTLLGAAESSADGQTVMVAYKVDDNGTENQAAFRGRGSDEWVALTIPMPTFLSNSYEVVVQASDGKVGGTDTQTINVNVTDVSPEPPVNTVPGTQTVLEDATLTFSSAYIAGPAPESIPRLAEYTPWQVNLGSQL